MSTSTSVAVVLVEDPMKTETIAVAGFLAGYCGSTRRSYATDLRLFAAWCHEANLSLFSVRRSHIELFGRWMEETGRMRSTVARRLSTLASFYKYCEQEQLVDRNPALNVRRPKVDYESRALGLDRNELGAFLVQAGLGSPRDHALASLLALNGLRISEALGADIDDLDFERGHRRLKIVRKGGKFAVIPLAPRTSRALDLYIGERTMGPIFLGAKGGRMDRYAADRTVKRLARRAAITKRISPHSLRHKLHHRCFGRRSAPARPAGGGQPFRPSDHDAVRPRPGLARPPCDLRRRHLLGRRLPLRTSSRRAGDTGRRQRPHPMLLSLSSGNLAAGAGCVAGQG
jgi:site-specific recombinase XerD